MSDYVKQIITAKELEEKEHWAVKKFESQHGWIGHEMEKLKEESDTVADELRDALRDSGDPSFVQPLQGAYLRLEATGAGTAEGGRTRSNTPDWPEWRDGVSGDYGRFWRWPHEEGGAAVRRVPYSTLRRIGYWNDKFDKRY